MKNIKSFKDFYIKENLSYNFGGFDPGQEVLNVIEERLMELGDYITDVDISVLSHSDFNIQSYKMNPNESKSFRIFIDNKYSEYFQITKEVIECFDSLRSNLSEYGIELVSWSNSTIPTTYIDPKYLNDSIVGNSTKYISLKFKKVK